MITPLATAERAALLALARAAVAHRLGTAPAPGLPTAAALEAPRAAFVTLSVAGEPRATLGELAPQGPLAATVARLAARAALDDPRQPALTAADLPGLSVRLALLGPLRSLGDGPPRPGLDGAAVTSGWHRGLLLPSAATGKDWPPEVFLKHACLAAGLPARAHLEPGTRVEVFEVEEFGE
jgi:AMMECR1 domain-containing protein